MNLSFYFCLHFQKALCYSILLICPVSCKILFTEIVLAFVQASEDPLTVKVDHLKVLNFPNFMIECLSKVKGSHMQMILMHLLIHALAFLFVQDKPYNKDDDVIKATSFEVISTLRDVLKTSSLWRDHVQTYTQVCSSLKIFCDLSFLCKLCYGFY